MKRTGRVPFMKLQIGFWVLAAFALLLWATLQSGEIKVFGREERLRLSFPSVGGLEEGATVRLNGVPVGHVRDISLGLGANDVIVELGVKHGTRARLHRGAAAQITSVGLLSELYVELDGGDLSQPGIANESEIRVGTVADPQAMFKKLDTMADSLDVTLANLTSASRNISRGKGTVGRLMQDDRLYDQMVELSRTANDLAARMNENQARVSDRLLSLASAMDSLTRKMQHGEGSVAQLINSGEVHRNLASSTARADSMLGVIASGQGMLGRLYADSTLYEDTKALVASMKRLMAEIEKNPKKYFKFSIF